MYPKYCIFLSKSWAGTEDSKIVTKSLNMAHETFQCCYVLKATRLCTLAPPKTEGQLSICRQVNSF